MLTTWPEKVPGLEFNDVVVDVEGMKGIDGALPADITYNTPYATPFSFDITRNPIIEDKEKL